MVKIIDFYAQWCKPCKMYDTILPEVCEEYDFELEKFDVEDPANRQLVEDLEVQGLPTLVIVKDGMIKGTLVGGYGKDRLLQKIGAILGYSLLDPATEAALEATLAAKIQAMKEAT